MCRNLPLDSNDPTISRTAGPLAPELSDKLSANLSAAHAAAKELAQHDEASSPSLSKTLADHLLSPDSPLFKDLNSASEREYATQLARSLHVPLGAQLEQVALRWTGFEANFAGTDGAPLGGFTSLVQRISDEATSLGAEIRLREVVSSFELVDGPSANGKNVRITTRTDGGKGEERTYEAPTALCTIPLGVLQHSQSLFYPELPARRRATIERTHVGALNKLLLSYPSAWWPAEVGSFTVLPVQTPSNSAPSTLEGLFSSTTLSIASLAAPSGIPGSSASLLVMIGAEAARQVEHYPRPEVSAAAHAYLAKRLAPGMTPPAPTHDFLTRWAKHEFTRGATTTPVLASAADGHPGDVRTPLDFVELSRPVWNGSLGFAGEHTDLDHRGSIAGAIVSGEREAERIHRLLLKSERAERTHL